MFAKMKKACGNKYKHKKKAKKFAKDFKKSYDFRNTSVSIDSKDQQLAELTADPKLINYIKNAIVNEIEKIPFAKGILTLSKKDEGLYNGHFADTAGQVIEKFDDQTIEILAKNLELKNLYTRPVEAPAELNVENGHIKIKYGDFELEIKKSIHRFVSDFRKTKGYGKNEIRKSIKAWRRNMKDKQSFRTDLEAAQELSRNWDQHKEGFYQILHGIKQTGK